MRQYILGVDGGNTKTDYFLFDTKGNFIDFLRSGTCSHEGLKDSFDGSYRVMKAVFDEFLAKNKIEAKDIVASVFGLAGVDTPYQKQRIEEVIAKLGFNNYKVVNDSFLGIKAGSPNGSGVCSINGTGTSSGGIDEKGNYLQVGGIGSIVGDEAGGSWIARRAIRAVFDSQYRFGKPTMLKDIVFNSLNITDKYYLMEAISGCLTERRLNLTALTISVFDCANQGDEVSLDILKEMADNLARSAGGCVVNLDFSESVNIILAGSVWVKGSNPTLVQEFKKKIKKYTNKKCNIIVLQVPPATGAVVWALELATNAFPSIQMRKKICKNVENQLTLIEASK